VAVGHEYVAEQADLAKLDGGSLREVLAGTEAVRSRSQEAVGALEAMVIGGAIRDGRDYAQPKICGVIGGALILKLQDADTQGDPGWRYLSGPWLVLPSCLGNASRQRHCECDYEKKPCIEASAIHQPLLSGRRAQQAGHTY
jgi:hypothetical protein